MLLDWGWTSQKCALSCTKCSVFEMSPSFRQLWKQKYCEFPQLPAPSYLLPSKLPLGEQCNQALSELLTAWRWSKVQVLCQADSLSAQVDALRWLLIRYLSYQNHQFKGYLWNPLNCSVFAQTIENREVKVIYTRVWREQQETCTTFLGTILVWKIKTKNITFCWGDCSYKKTKHARA